MNGSPAIPRSRNGFFVQNAAQPYQGVNLQFGVGWNARRRELGGEVAHDRLVNLSGTVVPVQHVSLTFNYDDTSTDRSGVDYRRLSALAYAEAVRGGRPRPDPDAPPGGGGGGRDGHRPARR